MVAIAIKQLLHVLVMDVFAIYNANKVQKDFLLAFFKRKTTSCVIS